MILALLIVAAFLVALYAVDYDLRCLRDQIAEQDEQEALDYALLHRLIDDLSPGRRAEY